MQLDLENFPIIRMRDHSEGEEEDVMATRDMLVGLLEGGRRFVLVADRIPSLSDLTEVSPLEKKLRAQMFKAYRGQLVRLCAGMIIVGKASNLPQPLAKAIEAFTSAMGVAVVFAASAADAETIAQARLAA